MEKTFKFILVIFFSVFAVVGCVRIGGSQKNIQNGNLSVSDRVQPGQVAVIESDIIVTKPLSNETVSSPLEINGRAKVSESTVFYRLKDIWNNVIIDGFTVTSAGLSEWGSYSAKLEFDLPNSPVGWLEVYGQDQENGQEKNLIRLPVKFKDFNEAKVKVYFNNTEGDPALKDCSKVYSVERKVGYDNTLLVSAIGELLIGPSEEDKNNGFVSQIPTDGVMVQSLEIKDGVAYIDFNQALQQGVAGSCRVIAIRSQITETLKQFKEVKEVVISIDGNAEDILQP